MNKCQTKEDEYLAEDSLSDCLSDSRLLQAWNQTSKELVNISGGLETGGGVAIDKSLLPHLKIEDNETLVLTAAHIVTGAPHTLLGTYDAEGQLQDLYRGQVVYSDMASDLAIVKVNISDRNQIPHSINYYDLRQAQTGEEAMAFRPDDEERLVGLFKVRCNDTYGAVTDATLRARHPQIKVSKNTNITLLDRPDQDGTSGSPLIGKDGKILGLVSQRIANARCNNVAENQSSCAGTVAISASQIRLFLKKADRELQNTISK
jgi:hypothetical protein